MESQYARTETLAGKKGIENLQQSHVAIFGVGGVGGYVVESLVRSGVGEISIIDKDEVSLSNINRQIIANHETIGENKVDVFKKRCLSINPNLKIHTYCIFFLPKNASLFDFKAYDYVVDAMDIVTAKLELIVQAKTAGVPIISCMGAGNKLDSTKFKLADLYETKVCSLAKVMRRECKKRGIESLCVLYSEEEPVTKNRVPGSTAFAPAVAGLLIAEKIFREIVGNR